MSLADDYVLTRPNGEPLFAQERPTEYDRLVVEAESMASLMTSFHNDVDFGPFVETADTPVDKLDTRRCLRLLVLLSQFHPTRDEPMEGLWWLDRPNESLEWKSPFEATAADEAFVRANALVFLTGGKQVEPDTIEAALFSDFCTSGPELIEALGNGRGSLLTSTFQALHKCTGSLAIARLVLTCASVSGERSATLYRLTRECDAATIDAILRMQFGFRGEGLDR